MTNIPPLIQYFVLLAITIVFTSLAIENPKKTLFSLISGICWFTFSLAHFALSDPTGILTTSLSWLFLGFGILFISHAVIVYAHALSEKRYSVEFGE